MILDLESIEYFINMIPKAQATKEKLKLDFIKIEEFVHQRILVKKQHTDWEKCL